MKKISLKNLNEMQHLSREQLKNVTGGNFSILANCSAKCANGTTITITDCRGTCSSTDNVSVSCSGSSPITKNCPPVTPPPPPH